MEETAVTTSNDSSLSLSTLSMCSTASNNFDKILEGAYFNVDDEVSVLPIKFSSMNSCNGKIVKVLEDHKYCVKYYEQQENGEWKIKEDEFEFNRISKPLLLSKDEKTAFESREKMNCKQILLQGREMEEVWNTMSKIWSENEDYKELLLLYDGKEEYDIHNGIFTCRMISYQILEFLDLSKYRWKLKCLFCNDQNNNENNNNNGLMNFTTTHYNRLLHLKKKIDIKQFLSQGFFTSTCWCDYCSRKIYNSEFEWRCPCMHDMCSNCFVNLLQDWQQSLLCLQESLSDILPDDCIFEIASFAKGYIVEFRS